MANIPNARRYRSTGTNRSGARAAGNTTGWQQYDGGANHHAGPRAPQDNPGGNSGSSGWLIAAVLVFAALLFAFPTPVLVFCLIAFAVMLFFGTK